MVEPSQIIPLLHVCALVQGTLDQPACWSKGLRRCSRQIDLCRSIRA